MAFTVANDKPDSHLSVSSEDFKAPIYFYTLHGNVNVQTDVCVGGFFRIYLQVGTAVVSGDSNLSSFSRPFITCGVVSNCKGDI